MSLNVQDLIAEADRRAELTVSVIRMLIAASLGVVTAVTIATTIPDYNPFDLDDAGDLLSVIGVATTVIYLGFGAATYTVIQRGHYRGWMAWPFVTIDAAIALVSVWLALESLGLSGAYAPLTPAVIGLFIVMVFGALRYSPALQAYVTGLMVLGLAAIVAATNGFIDPAWVVETEDPAAMLLIAPLMFIRLAMLASVGAVLVIAVSRARSTLRNAMLDAARRENLTRYLPREIGALLSEGDVEEMRRGRRDPIAVLFVDIRGFTALSEALGPEALSALVSDYRRLLLDCAEHAGGVIDKFVGDGAMIVFGLSNPAADDARAAIACAREIVLRMERRNGTSETPLRLAMGLAWGEGFVGAVGDADRLEFTVLGDVVNVASRLEERAKEVDATLATDAATLARAGENTEDWRSLGSEVLRGRASETELFTLVERMPRAA